MWPAHLCFVFLIALMISLTPVSCRNQVFRFWSGKVMPSIMRSILRCATAIFSIVVLFSAHVSQPYVITGRMCSSCIFLFIFMLALQPLVMLFTLPKAAQPSAIFFLISGSRSPSFLDKHNCLPPRWFYHQQLLWTCWRDHWTSLWLCLDAYAGRLVCLYCGYQWAYWLVPLVIWQTG